MGNPFEFTMLALAETIIRQTDSSSKLEFRPLPEDAPSSVDPTLRVPRKRWDGVRAGSWRMVLSRRSHILEN